MRKVVLDTSMSLEGVGSDREHLGAAVPVGVELVDEDRRWVQPRVLGESLIGQLADARRLALVEARPFPSGVVVQFYRPKHN